MKVSALSEVDAGKQHESAVEALCRRFNVPKEEVARLYGATLAGMAGAARIRDYLPTLVSSRVRDVLRTRAETPGPDPGLHRLSGH